MLLIILRVDAVQQMDGSIAASRTYNRFDAIVFECPQDVGSALIGRTGIHIHVQAVGVRTDHRLQSPRLDGLSGFLNRLLRNPVGR